jgi:hypothetical protein
MDVLLFWNHCALEANRISHTNGTDPRTLGPTGSSRALAIIHLAIHDAYVGAKGKTAGFVAYDPTGLGTPPPNVSVNGAISGAAHETLRVLYSNTALLPDFNLANHLSMATVTFNEPNWPASEAYGRTVAQHILGLRNADPDANDMGYDQVAPRGKGQHQKDPDNPGQPYHAPYYGKDSTLFASTKRHGLLPPPQPGSNKYEDYLVEVRDKGIQPELMGNVPNNNRRKVDETIIGVYWGYDGARLLGTPPRLYNQVVRVLAEAKGNTLEKNVRLFTLINTAMGDAGILAWEQKYLHNLWRPVAGVREHDNSFGFNATPGNNVNNNADTEWLPYGAPNSNKPGSKNFTPPFPAYPSGHATFGAAAFHITRLFYGVTGTGNDNLFNGLSFVSDEYNGVTTDNKGTVRPRHVRNFPRGLWQMIEENGMSRVFIGVHWTFDSFLYDSNNVPDLANLIDANGKVDPTRKVGGVPLGLAIAEDVFRNLRKSSVGPSTPVV